MGVCLADPDAASMLGDIARFLGSDCDALFNTFCFLFLFLPLTLTAYWSLSGRNRLVAIAAASVLFYGFWDIRYVPLLIVATLVDFVVASRIHDTEGARARKRWLAASIVFNLGLLGAFKYANMAGDTAVTLLSLAGFDATLPYGNIVLPVGISFYTFQTMSYTIDVYRGHVEPTRDLVKYFAFVSLFPQLVAGPIIRYRTLSDQLDDLPRRPDARFIQMGVAFFAIGLFKKTVVADTIATGLPSFWGGIEPLWADPFALSSVQAWTAVIGYTVQLYFDFSGYSDMAIGLGAWLGLRFPVNFRAPHQSLNPGEYWRRWHISLGTFLRDYLFIPLGGSRGGSFRHDRNLVIVMTLAGLWHGAMWTRFVWGIYHGLLLVLYRHTSGSWDRMPKVAQRTLNMSLMILGLVTFRAGGFAEAGHLYALMFQWTGPLTEVGFMIALFATLLFTMIAKPSVELQPKPNAKWAALLGFFLAASLVAMTRNDSPFLYYQF